MSVLQEFIREYKEEAAKTRRVLERIPVEHFGWKPHEKNTDLRGLAQHIANVPSWIGITVQTDGLDFANPMPRNKPVESNEELLAFFDQRFAENLAILESADEAFLADDWTMRAGPQIFFTKSKKEVLREFVFNHIVHHRGQLTVYMRLLDIPVPGIYGPSADER